MTTSEDVQTNVVSMKLIEISGTVHSNQMVQFPTTSSNGNKYTMVMYDNDTNDILAKPLKIREQKEIVRAKTVRHDFLTSRGFKPLTHILDNECPAI